jgi:hypothetical protein
MYTGGEGMGVLCTGGKGRVGWGRVILCTGGRGWVGCAKQRLNRSGAERRAELESHI